MTIKLYNTLSKSKEIFKPIDPNNIGIYLCGLTVYDKAHIGNARAMVVFDVLYRLLTLHYGLEHITYVRNITDVDDKINARAKERNIPISTLTLETIEIFHQDMEYLHCLALHQNTHNSKRIEPKATQHIAEMIAMIQKLITNNHAYSAEGHVLFAVKSFAKYGQLSRRTNDEMLAGARVEVAPYKKDPGDFILWKPAQKDEPGWESPWGYGRPGWHIECSAMSTKYLGANFDIHGGGIDLQFPHHENEIAQSICANPNSKFANYWVHNGFLTVNGEKMSKSLNNFITVNSLTLDKIKGEIIRYVLLSTHYRKPLDWNDKAVKDASKALNNFYDILAKIDHETKNTETIKLDTKLDAKDEFVATLNDDLNTPKALAILHELASNIHKEQDESAKLKLIHKFKAYGQLLGLFNENSLDWFKNNDNDSNKIEAIINERNLARQNKDWAKADKIRLELEQMNIIIKDHKDGTTSWHKG